MSRLVLSQQRTSQLSASPSLITQDMQSATSSKTSVAQNTVMTLPSSVTPRAQNTDTIPPSVQPLELHASSIPIVTPASIVAAAATMHKEASHKRFDNLRIRNISLAEPIAEFLGTMVLVLIGTSGNAQGVLFNNPNVSTASAGGWQSVTFGWALGVSMGAWIAGGTSGGHINPAVTITLATFRGFPWRRVPGYILAQLLGALAGAALTYATYFHAISLAEGGAHVRTVPGTASIFGTYAVSYISDVSAFFNEFLATFLLVFVVFNVNDPRNSSPFTTSFIVPIVLFFIMLALGFAFGAQTGFSVNPARDFGPRVLSAIVGYGSEVFTFRNHYWLWTGILAPILGALTAGLVYDVLLYREMDSFVQRRLAKWIHGRAHNTETVDEKAHIEVREVPDDQGADVGQDSEGRYSKKKLNGGGPMMV